MSEGDTQDMLTRLGAVLERRRLRRRLSRPIVAKLANLSENTIYRIEAGHDAHLSTLHRYAASMNCKLTIVIEANKPQDHNR
jgi:transcriptional regulator with XRE-family HTH domain